MVYAPYARWQYFRYTTTQIELYALSTTTQPQYNGRRCTETDLKLIAYVRSASEKHLLPYDNSVEQM